MLLKVYIDLPLVRRHRSHCRHGWRSENWTALVGVANGWFPEPCNMEDLILGAATF